MYSPLTFKSLLKQYQYLHKLLVYLNSYFSHFIDMDIVCMKS